jgi:hypothetical protein
MDTYASSVYVGRFFVFLLSAQDVLPLTVYFRDRETSLKHRRKEAGWKEKVHLSPAILSRKWMEYRYRERYISSVHFDNVLPLQTTYPFASPVDSPIDLTLLSHDKSYRDLRILLYDEAGEPVARARVERLYAHRGRTVSLRTARPGVYRISISDGETCVSTTGIVSYRGYTVGDTSPLRTMLKEAPAPLLFCSRCRSPIHVATADVSQSFLHKNYIPIKEYIDLQTYGYEGVIDFVKSMNHPGNFTSGLTHLLNMIRLASLEDEITIMTNLYRDDPPFAYFITDRLFLFSMIPILYDRDLERIFNTVDDEMLALSLQGEGGLLCGKVLRNVSRRRADRIRSDLKITSRPARRAEAKEEVNRIIKTYFEQRYGRDLRIPSGTRTIYRDEGGGENAQDASLRTVFHHRGPILLFDGRDVIEIPGHANPPFFTPHVHLTCVEHDRESYGDEIFTCVGMTESTVYLRSSTGIRYGLLHVYRWESSLEDYERIENIGRHSIIPVSRSAPSMILTVGVIDGKGRALEQVIRINVSRTQREER